jgi:hypothetical protein
MAWTIRNVFKKPGGDPLYEFFTTYPYTEKELLKDPSIIDFGIWRNIDRSIGIIFQTWENEESFQNWKLTHNIEISSTKPEVVAWTAETGITILRQIPDSENQNWGDPKYIIEGTLGYHRVTIEQILAGE